MDLLLGKTYYLNVGFKPKGDWTLLALTVYIRPRSERLNSTTGKIVPIKELDDLIEDAINEVKGKNLDDVKGLAYLPHTLEIVATRLWDKINESLGYQSELAKIRLESGEHFFVEYVGREDAREPKYKKAKRRSYGQED